MIIYYRYNMFPMIVWVSCVHVLLGHLCNVIGFSHRMLRWCSLHCLNLGVDLWAGASAFEMLLADQDLAVQNHDWQVVKT